MCLRLIVGLSLILHVSEINGVLTGASGPVLACHIPLEVKIFADSSYQALSADLKSCTQITLSSVNALFLPSSNTSLASILVSEKRSLELLKQQTPEAEFSFSLRSTQMSPATRNLRTMFNRTTSVAHLVDFLRVNKLKSFDIAWDLIQSAPEYGPLLKSLKTTLGKEGFNLTTTIGVEVDRIDAFHVTKIASIVDRVFLVSSYNRHYSGNQYPVTEKKVQQAFYALEHNEGAFLKLYSTLNLSWKKIVVGLSLQTLVWKLSSGTILGTQFNQYQAILQLQSYYESCKTVNSTWRLQQQPSPFYKLAVPPANDQWMIHVDPLTLGKRVDLLRQYRFGGVALYDYYQDDFAGICSSKGKIYPLIQQAGQSIRNSSLAVPFPQVDINNGLCIPFLGLTNECKGAFDFGTPKISTNSVEFNNTSTSSTVMVTRTTLPVVNDVTTARVPSQYTAESVTIPTSSSITEATGVLGASWALVSDGDNLIRTRRSSLSSGELLGTEPSYSYLKPPGFDLFDIMPRISSSISKVELPALKSLTTVTVSPNAVTKASNVKVELSHNNQTHSSGTGSTTLSSMLQLPETGDNQAALQESKLSTTDIVSSRSLVLKSEIPTAVESGSAVPATSPPELGTPTEIEQAVTHFKNAIESDAPFAPLSLSTSEMDRAMDFPVFPTVSSLETGIDSSRRTKMETPINFDPQDEATTDVTTYASDVVEDITDFVDRISTERSMVDVIVSLDDNHILPTVEQPALVLANNENTVAPAEVESDLENISTTRPLALIEEEARASSQYSDSVTDMLEQTTSDVSSPSTGDHLESSTMAPVYYDTFGTMGTNYDSPLLQDLALAPIQQVTDDETASSSSEMTSPEPDWSTIKQPINRPEETFPSASPLKFSSSLSSVQASSSEISIETPFTTLSPQALFSSAATGTFTEDNPLSDIYSAVSIQLFDLVDAPSTSATLIEEQHLHLNSASSSSNEDVESTSTRDFSTSYDSSLLEVDAEMHTEHDIPIENSFAVVTSSVPEWSTSEETADSETHVLHSTVFDASLAEDYHSEYQEGIGIDYPGTLLGNQLAIVEEGSAESSPASTVFLPTLEPTLPPSLIDVVSTSLIPEMTEISSGHSSNSPTGSATLIEETSFSTRIGSSTTETPTSLDASIAAIELADSDFTAFDKNSLFGKPQLETTSMSTITDSNEIQFTGPSEEDSSDESAVPYSTASTDEEMTNIPTGYEAKSPISSLQTDEERDSDELLPTTWQTSVETSLPPLELDEVPRTLESLSPFTVTDTSSTFLIPILMESSTEWQHFESSPTKLKIDTEEIQSPNDLSTHYSSTVTDTTGIDMYASSSDTNLSPEIADSEVTSPAPDWNSDEVFTQSEFLSSASIDVELTEDPAVNKHEMPAISTTTFLDEQLTMSELSSVPLETSTDIHFSPSVSNEFHSTFEPILPPILEVDLVASMEDIQPTNAIDLSTSNSVILPDITTANTNLMAEENELISSTTSSIHWEDAQSNLPIEEAVPSDIPFAVDDINNFDTTHLMEISEPTGSVQSSPPEDGSHSTVKEDFPNSLFVSFGQTPNPVESDPSSLMSESPNSGLISTDPPLLYSTSASEQITTILEGYTGEVFTSLAVVSSNDQVAPVELSPNDAEAIPEGSSSMPDEFSGTSELPFDLADTSTFSIPMELLTSQKPVPFLEDAQTSTIEELSSSLLPPLPQSSTSGIVLVDNEDDPFSSTTSRYLEDSHANPQPQPNMPIKETFSTLVPFEMSVSSDGSFGTSYESLGVSHELSKDFAIFEPSLSTENPPISGEFQLLDTGVTTSNEEPVDDSIQTVILGNEGSGGNSLLSMDVDGSGSPAVLIATDQPFETLSIAETSVTVNRINLFSSSLTDGLLEHVDVPFINDVAFSLSTETTGTSKSSITSDVFSTDETFETSSPSAASAELVLDTTTSPSLSQPSAPVSINDVGTVSSVLITDDYTMAGSGDQPWVNTLSEDANVSLTGSLEDTVSPDPPLPYTLVNLDVVSSSEGYDGEIAIASAATSSEEPFSIGKFSPSVAITSTEGSSSTFDEFSGTSEFPFDVADTTAFFYPTELSTGYLNFISGNSVTFSGDAPTLTEEELTSSGSPIFGEISTSGFELTDEEENRISHTTSLDSEDSHPTVPPEENLPSPIPFDISVSPISGSFEQTLTPLQSNALLLVTDALTSRPLVSVVTSGELSEGFTTADEGVVEMSTMAPTFENEGSAENWIILLEEDGSGATPGFLNATAQPNQNENLIEILEEDGSGTTPAFLNATAQPNANENWIVILEEDGSGAVTPGVLNATDQPSEITGSTSEIELTTSGVHLSFSSPAAETYETGTVTSGVESTSVGGSSDNVTGQELVKDSFATTGIEFPGTMDLISVPASSTDISIALTSPPTTDISTPEHPPSTTHLPVNVTESQLAFDITTALPPLSPNAPSVSSPDPVFDKVTVSLKPPSAYNMMASSTETWYHTPTESSGSLVSGGSSNDSLLLLSTSTTETLLPSTSIDSFPATPEPLLTSSIAIVELSTPSSSTPTYSLTPPPFPSSTLMRSTTSPDAVPSSSTSSESPTSVSPNLSDIPASTTVPPIINLWNLLMSRITTADGILALTKNSTLDSLPSGGTTSSLLDEEPTGSSTSSMPSPTGIPENSALVTLPFWLVTRPSPDSSTVFPTGQALSQETTPTPVAILRATTRNTKIPVRTSTMASSTQPPADPFATRPIWSQGHTKPSKLTSNVLTSTRLSTTTVSSTEALHTSPSESTTTPLPTSSIQLNLPTNVNPMVNGHPYVRNCTEHVVNPSSSVSSVTNVVMNDDVVQPNGTAGMGDKKQNFSFHLEKLSEALNLLVASYTRIKDEEIQPSVMCEAARDSILLKSLFCLNQSPSAMKDKRFPNVVQLIKHLAPEIIANLTSAMNLEVKDSVHVTEFDIDQSNATTSTTESIVPMSTERTTRSTILTQHSTEPFLLNLSTTLRNNVPMSPLPSVLNISLESVMENLAQQLKDTQLSDVISAVNRLNHDVPAAFLESLIQNSSSELVYFGETIKAEGVKEEVITTEEQTSTSSTTTPTTKVPDVLQMDFWKLNRRNPVNMLQRKARTGVGSLPTIGRYWRDTTKSISSLFRPFAKPAVGRS